MLDYKLYYWNVPFRGIFPCLLLEDAGAKYEWRDASELYPDKSLKLHHPGMAPPYLFDLKRDRYLSQMPAIMMHLACAFDYLPKKKSLSDLALKTVMDCHDVLLEITNSYGKEMWNLRDWREFRTDRLAKWMKIFELTGEQEGLKKDSGFLLGPEITVADIATSALFGTMMFSFPELETDLKANAPRIHRLCERIEKRPRIRSFLESARGKWEHVYCGGEIEISLRRVLKTEKLRAA